MKFIISFIPVFFLFSITLFSQTEEETFYKKRVLDNAEMDIISSYYDQSGENAAVTGGIGNEDLNDITTNVVIRIPQGNNNILTADMGFSAYSSASSSNVNPFDGNGSSHATGIKGSPWVASSGASQSDTWTNFTGSFEHYSDNRNNIVHSHISFSNEHDYVSTGIGGGYTWLLNEQNTEFSIKTNLYFDNWKPVYPTELKDFESTGGNLTHGIFYNTSILDENGNATDKYGTTWNPDLFSSFSNKGRNTYSLSFSFSQILSRNAQFAIFFDLVQQSGLLSNPMQRVYFSDKADYFIGNAESIPYYTSPENKDVFMLADDVERLPDNRFKIPIGLRLNYFINEYLTVRSYYRYYYDTWGISSNTVRIELPIKILRKFTLYPSYRFYNQSAADYYGDFDTHLSTENYYTSDFDLSKYHANQYGFGIKHTDIFTKLHISKLGFKSIDINYNHYERNTGLKADFIGFSLSFVWQ